MLDSPNKLSKFWQELKRRSVLRSLAIYAGSAFVFLEAATIIFPRWGFPDWTIDLVLYLLILGAFITIIVSWIFDITPQGVQKTKPIEEITETEIKADSKVWKAATYISLVIIVALIILNIVPIGKTIKAGDIQSLLILPFDNFTGNDSLDYVAAGMHSALIGDMGQISALRVISKKTASVYRTMDMSLPQIAKEINMEAVIEPSVMCYGDSVCIQIRVITMYPEEKQLWVAEYKEEKSQILNLYSKITKQIANDLMVELTPGEKQLFARSLSIDREAYDAYLMGSYYLDDASEESLMKAREYLNSAVEKDPEWAPLYTGLTMVWISIAQMGYESPEIAGPKIFENLNKALELDPNNADSHFISAASAWLSEWNWEKGEKEFLKALAINPNNAQTRVFYAHLLSILQRPGEALKQGQLAIDLDPLNPLIQVLYAALLVSLDDCETALAHLEKVLATDPEHILAYSNIESTAYRCKDYNRTFEAVMNILPLEEDTLKEIEAIFDAHGFVAAYEEIMHHMEALALNSYVVPIEMAYRYVMANQYDKAMDWVEKGFELHDQNMPYIATGVYNLDPLHNNPRFIDILKKMDLPLPKD